MTEEIIFLSDPEADSHATNILFLVTGRNKAGILKEILGNGENRQKYPAGPIHPVQGSLTWLIDKQASSSLARGLNQVE